MPALHADRTYEMTQALLRADLAALVDWHRIICDDLSTLSRRPDLPPAMVDKLGVVAGALASSVLRMRELVDQVDRIRA